MSKLINDCPLAITECQLSLSRLWKERLQEPQPWGSKGRAGGSCLAMHAPLIRDRQSNPLLGKSAACGSRRTVEAGGSKRLQERDFHDEMASFPLSRPGCLRPSEHVFVFFVFFFSFYPQSTAAPWKNSKQASDLSWFSFWNCILKLCGKVGSQRVANNLGRGCGNFSSLVSTFNHGRLEGGACFVLVNKVPLSYMHSCAMVIVQ